ncbi:MAG: DUF1572 family protein [Flavobacteriales bacterium]
MAQNNFTEASILQFNYYKSLGEKTFDQLSDEELFWQYNTESNSIAVIVNHLHGNMLSRWTDFLTTDGEKEWRNRDQEFEDIITTRKELLGKWNSGWACLFKALSTVNESNFNQLIYIRNQGHTITEAILRQLAHYSYHVGEIVYIGRMIKGAEWQSLSIAKGNSQAYNAEKFSQEKKKQHFTEEFLNKSKKKNRSF